MLEDKIEEVLTLLYFDYYETTDDYIMFSGINRPLHISDAQILRDKGFRIVASNGVVVLCEITKEGL